MSSGQESGAGAQRPDRAVVMGPGVPPAVGPYSQAVRGKDFLFVSGQPGIDPATGKPAGDTMAAQARQALRNLKAVLEAGGSRCDLVVNATVIITDFSDFAAMNEAFTEVFPSDPPARMTMQSPLPGGLLISVGCIALMP